jgi:hypothetical protein
MITPELESIVFRMTDKKMHDPHLTVGLDDYDYIVQRYGDARIFGVPVIANRRFREGWIALGYGDTHV